MARHIYLVLAILLFAGCSSDSSPPSVLATPTGMGAYGALTMPTPTETLTLPVLITQTTANLPTPTAVDSGEPLALLFASDRDGAGALYLMQEPNRPLVRLTEPTESSAWQPAMSFSRNEIAYTGRRDGQQDIAVVDAQGGSIRWLTEHLADDHSPAWSWDGTRLAWVSERQGRGQVWLMDVSAGESGATLVNGPQGALRTRNPAWMPDGHLLFSAVDENGVESLYRYDPETGASNALTTWPLKGSESAANGENEVVFVGWEEDPPWRGLYLLRPGGRPDLLWKTTGWIGEPEWSADGKSIFFSHWRDEAGSHDIWVISSEGGEPRRVTAEPSWEADAVVLSGAADTLPPAPKPVAMPERARPERALGFNVANLDNGYLLRDLGFGWGKGFAQWERIETQPGEFYWTDVDNTVNRLEEAGLRTLLRVDRTPTWARPAETTGSHPPTDLAAYERFLETLAARYRGRVAAYELWNEPNLMLEWGNQPPDPARYVEMLHIARAALQRGDPDARLIVGALAVADNTERSMSDIEWMEGFYRALGDTTPRPYDAFATHPYGFGQPPGRDPSEGPSLRHLERQRAVMVAWGDLSPMWLTELGYARETPGWDLGEHGAWVVDDDTQARYLVETLAWLEQYDFVEGIFLFNLDFSTVDWYEASEQMRAYAILDSSRRPLPAFSALRRYALRE